MTSKGPFQPKAFSDSMIFKVLPNPIPSVILQFLTLNPSFLNITFTCSHCCALLLPFVVAHLPIQRLSGCCGLRSVQVGQPESLLKAGSALNWSGPQRALCSLVSKASKSRFCSLAGPLLQCLTVIMKNVSLWNMKVFFHAHSAREKRLFM